MNSTEFFLKWKGKTLDYDGIYGGQCVDVIKAYFVEVLKRPIFKGNAIDYWTDIPGFKRIKKTFYNYPLPGDIVVWGTSYNPTYGHIAICNWSRMFDFGAFSQNDPVGSPCQYKEYSYRNVLGWLRPKKRLETPIKVAFINDSGTEIISKIKEYLPVEFEITTYIKPINVPSGTLTTENAMGIISELDIKEPFVFIFYNPNPDSAYEVASIYPKRNIAFCTIPKGNPLTIPVHAFLHLLRKHINQNKIEPYIEDIEKYPDSWSNWPNFGSWSFEEQYNEIKRYL